jgi:hypothetical protein
MRYFIIHGAFGSPNENWFPWLKEKLQERGHEVIVPHFPTPEGQDLGNWMYHFSKYMDLIDESTVMIGHSLGPLFILSVLERIKVKIRASYFVAGFAGALGRDQFDSINKTFFDKEFDWETIKKNCSRFVLYNSDDDPYVPIEQGKSLARRLNGEMKVIASAGHFNAERGYTYFDDLLNDLEQ